jgi:DNA-binding HxlR family transcriptional regulator
VGKHVHTPASAAVGIEHAIRMLEGRWKLVILFHLFGGKTLRFSDLERAIPGISQKMLTQQLRQLEQDRIVTRIVHPAVPPKVEYHLTEWGQSLCPALDRLLTWTEHQPSLGRAERLDQRRRENRGLDDASNQPAAAVSDRRRLGDLSQFEKRASRRKP